MQLKIGEKLGVILKTVEGSNMEDFISRQTAIEMIEKDLPDVVFYKKEDAIECLRVVPSADCIDKRAIELYNQRIIELAAEKDALIKNYANCMKEYAKFIFDELDIAAEPRGDVIMLSQGTYDALKKLYTEGKV